MVQVYWLSFVDIEQPEGDRFLGVAIVEAETAQDAVHRSWMAGCNPGGQVDITRLPTDAMTEAQAQLLADTPFDTLMGVAELERRGFKPRRVGEWNERDN